MISIGKASLNQSVVDLLDVESCCKGRGGGRGGVEGREDDIAFDDEEEDVLDEGSFSPCAGEDLFSWV